MPIKRVSSSILRSFSREIARTYVRRIKHFIASSVGHQATFKEAKGRTKERKTASFTSHTQRRDAGINLCSYVSPGKNGKKLLPMPRG